MPKDLESRNITTALKGMAILVVVCAHYASNFAEDFYIRWLTECVNGFGMALSSLPLTIKTPKIGRRSLFSPGTWFWIIQSVKARGLKPCA